MVSSEITGVDEFTKSIIKHGQDLEAVVEEGEWFEITIKKMFDTQIITSLGYHIDDLLGFRLNSSDSTPPSAVRLRLGYFNTQLSQILHKAVCQMKLNELAHVSFELEPSQLDESFKKTSQASHQQPCLDLKFEINLISIEKTGHYIPIYELDEKQLNTLCLEHKNDANELFKRQLIRTAFRRYQKAMNYLIVALQLIDEKLKNLAKLDEIDEERGAVEQDELSSLKTSLKQTKSQLYANLAICQLKNNNNEMAIVNCTKCLEISRDNVKALFRRAQAHTNLNNFENAILDYTKAIQLDPSNQELRAKLAACEKLKKSSEQELAAKMKKLFS
jgi:FK506-binding protein 4/5